MSTSTARSTSNSIQTLTQSADVSKRTLVSLLENGSRDYEVMHDLLNEFIDFHSSAYFLSKIPVKAVKA